ncbi:MAG: hypothetical protein J1E00_04425 [Oscillospiraceae bacterium]|nr:hypothetical protein [Oscillospiraceae bacterium]
MKIRSLVSLLLVLSLLLVVACSTKREEEDFSESEESAETFVSDPSEETTSNNVSEETSSTDPSEESSVGGEDPGDKGPEFPLPPVPSEESDTVLELVASAPTSPGGFYPYQVFISEGISIHAWYTMPGVDAEGNLYLCWEDMAEYQTYRLFRLNDQTMLELPQDQWLLSESSDYIANAILYDDGSVSITGVLYASHLSFLPASKRSYRLEEFTDGRLVTYGRTSVFLQNLPGFDEESHPYRWDDRIYRAGATLFRKSTRWGYFRTDETERGELQQRETIYTAYDERGALVSQFLLYERGNFPTPCEMLYDVGHQGIMEEYNATDLYLGDYAFERVFEHWVVYGTNGETYLFLLYPDRCEAYRVHAGYHPETFSEASLNREADFEDPTDTWGAPKLEEVQAVTEGPIMGAQTPDAVCADENGMIYLLYQSGDIYRLQDGAHYTFTYPSKTQQWHVSDMICHEGVLYLLFEYSRFQDAVLHTVDVRTDGAESVQVPFPGVQYEGKTGAYLFANQKQGVLLCMTDYDTSYSVIDDRRIFYTMDGKVIPKEKELFTLARESFFEQVLYRGKTVSMGKMGEAGFLATIDETGMIWGVENEVEPEGGHTRYQSFYSLYDANCELYGEILLETSSDTARIGDYNFGGVKDARIVCGAGNAMYLLLRFGSSVTLYTVTID